MSYNYSAFLFATDGDGRAKNFSSAPTITVYDGVTEAVIGSPSPTLVNLATGLYKVKITIADQTDVIFKIVPPAADLADIADVAVFQPKAEQVIGENLDAAITTRSTLTQADILSDATPFPGAYIDAPVSTAGGGAVTVNATVAISATEAAAVASGLLAIRAYNTFAQTVTSTSADNLNAANKIWLSIKRNAAQTDDESIIFIEKTAGLTRVAGAAYATATDGSLTVTGSSGDWEIGLLLKSAATTLLGLLSGSYEAEIKYSLSGVEKPLWSGAAVITSGIVRTLT